MRRKKGVKNNSKSHLLIAGAGRSGTSFLVKYLTELGLDTQLSRGQNVSWDETANAGLEDMPLVVKSEELPYVTKTPWLYQLIDQVLEDPDFKIDGVIIPVRDLIEAASSRSVRELQNVHQNIPWMTKLKKPWGHAATVPGGVIYPVYPIDQARVLAVGFYTLLERLVAHDVPFVLLSFPRLIEEPEYLHFQLEQFLPDAVSKEQALKAHKKIADEKKVRVSKELKGKGKGSKTDGGVPSLSEIENIALNRELDKTREQVKELESKLSDTVSTLEVERTKAEKLSKSVRMLRHDLSNIKQSASWRLSKPVRLASKTLRTRGKST